MKESCSTFWWSECLETWPRSGICSSYWDGVRQVLSTGIGSVHCMGWGKAGFCPLGWGKTGSVHWDGVRQVLSTGMG